MDCRLAVQRPSGSVETTQEIWFQRLSDEASQTRPLGNIHAGYPKRSAGIIGEFSNFFERLRLKTPPLSSSESVRIPENRTVETTKEVSGDGAAGSGDSETFDYHKDILHGSVPDDREADLSAPYPLNSRASCLASPTDTQNHVFCESNSSASEFLPSARFELEASSRGSNEPSSPLTYSAAKLEVVTCNLHDAKTYFGLAYANLLPPSQPKLPSMNEISRSVDQILGATYAISTLYENIKRRHTNTDNPFSLVLAVELELSHIGRKLESIDRWIQELKNTYEAKPGELGAPKYIWDPVLQCLNDGIERLNIWTRKDDFGAMMQLLDRFSRFKGQIQFCHDYCEGYRRRLEAIYASLPERVPTIDFKLNNLISITNSLRLGAEAMEEPLLVLQKFQNFRALVTQVQSNYDTTFSKNSKYHGCIACFGQEILRIYELATQNRPLDVPCQNHNVGLKEAEHVSMSVKMFKDLVKKLERDDVNEDEKWFCFIGGNCAVRLSSHNLRQSTRFKPCRSTNRRAAF
ncbi:hypothetical protein TWF694_007644 [Orbilia ellipsospora]|uniref:Uncharacterized protein n=1 Tax=Orbilia ellipsospora TaxID=2528407 RepID=A0AAV9XK16_9PEZI